LVEVAVRPREESVVDLARAENEQCGPYLILARATVVAVRRHTCHVIIDAQEKERRRVKRERERTVIAEDKEYSIVIHCFCHFLETRLHF
jgi:hypothetical protein